MQAALEPFWTAYAHHNAYELANVLTPTAPPDNPGRLYDFYRASNEHQIEPETRSAIKYSQYSSLSPKEGSAWTDIFVAYWRAVGEILRADEATNQGRLRDRQWVNVYEAWEEVTNQIVKYVSNGTLPSWTIVCMFVAANHLRLLAMKADEQLAKSKGNVTFNSGFQDDIVSNVARNEKLEKAARIFNRMFALCLGDRFISLLCAHG